jgi:hypothetical protein
VAISSYFYDDKPYSAIDFANAFHIGFETGVLIRESVGGTLGFDIGGTNFTTIYEGKALIEGHFVQVTGTEILTVPAGTYDGQIVIQMDTELGSASLIVKQDRTPVQSATLYELPLYDCTVASNIITSVTDKRVQGGAIPNNHTHAIADVTGLQSGLDARATWSADPNGVSLYVGKYNNTGKPVRIFFTSSQPSASATEHRVWIQIDNF